MAGASSRLRPRPALKANGSSNSRLRRQRPVISYHENSTDTDDSELDIIQDDHTARTQTPSSRPRRRRTNVSYREDSAHSESNAAMSQAEHVAITQTPRSRRADAPLTTPTRSTRSTQSTKRKPASSRRKIATIGAKRQKNSSHQNPYRPQNTVQTTALWTGKSMPWTTLPYHIWASVFAYASHPLVSIAYDPLPSISWLVRMALVCKAFTEPALSALYFEPPIYEPRQISSLTSLLQNQNEKSTINYRAKVKHLSIDSMISPLMRHNFIESIIPFVTQLRGIALGVHSDDPKLCRLHTRVPMAHAGNYMSMFSILESAQTQLSNWTWNRTLDSHFLPLSSVKDVHRSSPFLSLKSLTFIDFHLPEMVEFNGVLIRGEEALADALNTLPSLRKLQFSLADVVNQRLMPLLPDNLQTLVLTSCYNLYSPALASFLLAKGQHIRELELSHNQSLSLSFLTDLSRVCPKLEILRMDLLYYNSHTTFNDSTPRYDSLLGVGEQPLWPMSLRRLELFQLRRWKTPAAELFFSSFVDTPRSLPNLRHMEIKASVDESSWRDRIAFRDKWVRRLTEVFLRKSSPPNPHLNSFAAFRRWKSQRGGGIEVDAARTSKHTRAAQRKTGPASETSAGLAAKPSDAGSDSDAPLVKVRRSARVKPVREGVYNESDSSQQSAVANHRRRRRRGPDDSSSEDSALEDEKTNVSSQRAREASEDEGYVQGLCNVVDIVIDNLRPAEEQLHESDFLDEERSGDEDWNGDDLDDERYAW